MRYPAPEVRDAFHKSDAMFQVICQVLENYFFSFGHQLDVIKVEDIAGETRAWVSCEGMDGQTEANLEATRLLNTQFKRKDGEATCVCPDPEKSVFRVYVTTPIDLEHLN